MGRTSASTNDWKMPQFGCVGEMEIMNMKYRRDSGWSDKNEMKCFLIFKKLKKQGFPRGMQSELCRRMEAQQDVNLSYGTIKAKVGNYKSVAGIIGDSHYSENTRRIYEQYGKYSIEELGEIIRNLPE